MRTIEKIVDVSKKQWVHTMNFTCKSCQARYYTFCIVFDVSWVININRF